MTGTEILARATRALKSVGIDGAGRDARRILAHVLACDPGRLTLVLPEEVTAETITRYDALIARRVAREPVSHLIGTRMFYGREFIVTPDVLDPRPETETLIEAALSHPFERVLDLGTGSGCILLTLLAETQGAWGLGTDLSPAALDVAVRNRAALGQGDGVLLRQSDWYDMVEGSFDLIVSNPPYIAKDEMADLAPELAHEPRLALTDEGDGLSAYRALAAGAPRHLEPGGRLLVEIGWQQGAAVSALMSAAGLTDVVVVADLDKRDRVVSARKA
ncbi:peptide chain release factor N(5)-glutamine methyltransferase [Phaeobacter sp. J2-8]|uniref:peptide chain release factor N(5)-glutamine methyltransferase n=1 Tax=Phaeobacter sp. J2-8 TaxID=2931394 RepID=UPI001FD44EDC|nr:peptide chain release factor N(5)-glutamine methyltransferase [Phaeobacter sp. J2-8]MCJ7873707.1 peptide chain release factor N(5)-glutamine methyltransferase [Phaeobacter sp. J2-8]